MDLAEWCHGRVCILFTHFLKSKNVFQGAFFLKFWPYVWLVFKSSFQSRAGYDGARTVINIVVLVNSISNFCNNKISHANELKAQKISTCSN